MTRAIYQVVFHRVPVGETFFHNGNAYLKVSTRTAHLLAYDRRFYFGRNEWVTVTKGIADAILANED